MKSHPAALGRTEFNESFDKLPGHWVLARLGKRVLRPGGMKLTRWMLNEVAITSADEVVEIAPGIGVTAREIFLRNPSHYWAVDADSGVIDNLKKKWAAIDRSFVHAGADATTLSEGVASVVVGEAFLTMQTENMKKKMVAEMARLLRPGGRYGLHELCVVSNKVAKIETLKHEISKAIRVNASPLALVEWKTLLTQNGFEVVSERVRPMELLRFERLLEDEGLWGSARIIVNALRHREAARRVLQMRRVFEKYAENLAAISIVATRRELRETPRGE